MLDEIRKFGNSVKYPFVKNRDIMYAGWEKKLIPNFLRELRWTCLTTGSLFTFKISDMREKWGRLDLFFNNSNDKIDDVIDKYVELSKKTCFKCGCECEMRNLGGWLVPACDECVEELK